MAVEQIYEALASFFDGYFFAILIATGVLFLLMFVTWSVYKTLSKRNIFQLSSRPGKSATIGDWFMYTLKYFFIFPLFSFLAFLIFAFSLFLMMKPKTGEEQTIIIFIAIVMMSTIRVSAYVHETMAEDFAKLIPLTMLSVLLINPSADRLGIGWSQISSFLNLIPGFLKYLVFVIVLEALLRGGTWLFSNLNRKDPEETPAERT